MSVVKTAEQVTDLLGWQNTRWGMTDAEIVNAVGASVLRRIEREVYAKMYAELIIPSVSVIGFEFQVIFQMEAATGRLAQVLIRHVSDDTAREPTAVFKAACASLTEMFGPPKRDGTSDVLVWAFPTTTIDVQLYYIEDIASEVAVRYLPTSLAANTKRISAF